MRRIEAQLEIAKARVLRMRLTSGRSALPELRAKLQQLLLRANALMNKPNGKAARQSITFPPAAKARP